MDSHQTPTMVWNGCREQARRVWIEAAINDLPRMLREPLSAYLDTDAQSPGQYLATLGRIMHFCNRSELANGIGREAAKTICNVPEIEDIVFAAATSMCDRMTCEVSERKDGWAVRLVEIRDDLHSIRRAIGVTAMQEDASLSIRKAQSIVIESARDEDARLAEFRLEIVDALQGQDLPEVLLEAASMLSGNTWWVCELRTILKAKSGNAHF